MKGTKQMKKFKKLGALIMAFAMVLSLSVTAFAADEGGTTAQTENVNATVTVGGLTEGEEAVAYRLIKYTDNKFNDYEFTQAQDSKGFLDYLIDEYGNAWKITDAASAIKALESHTINVDVIGEYVTEAVKQTGNKYYFPEGEKTSAEAVANGQAVLKLEPGWYLIVVDSQKSDKSYVPTVIFVQRSLGKTNVYANGSATTLGDKPTIDVKYVDGLTVTKEVLDDDTQTWKNNASAAVGETLNFRVKVTLPDFSKLKEYEMSLEDTLTNLEFVKGNGAADAAQIKSGITVVGIPNQAADEPEEDRENYELSSEVIKSAELVNGKLTITFNYDQLKEECNGVYSAIYVKYSATLKADAAKYTGYTAGAHQANNEVVLSYGTPENTKQAPKAQTVIYTYAFKLDKIGTDVNTDLDQKGAKFQVYDKADGDTPLSFVKVTEGGVTYYRPAEAGETANVTDIEANFIVRGLDEGTYYLKESATPEGYYAPAGMFAVTLKRTANAGALDVGAAASKVEAVETKDTALVGQFKRSDGAAYQLEFTIKNSTHPQLPTTGGMGTVIFTVGGVALMGAAAVLFFATRKKKAEQ